MFCARTILVLVITALCGCAPVARMQVFRPAAHDLTGIERVAILSDGTSASDSDVRRAVAESLVENRSYTLVEPAVLESVHPITDASGRTDRAAAQDAARQAGVDALLVCADAPAGGLRAELIDAASAEILAAPAAKNSRELADTIAPHYVPVEVVLARQWWEEGKANVAAGNVLARQGDWAAAEEKWQAAKEANPGNHAALHNLALAAEARQNYREAFSFLDQALDQFPLKLYHQTRKGMEERQTTFLAAAKQVEAIRAAAMAHQSPVGQASRLSYGDDSGQAGRLPYGSANQ